MKKILLTIFLASGLCQSCATLVHGERQKVVFSGGPESGTTKVLTQDGAFYAEHGAGSFMMTRSKSDHSVVILCPDGSRKQGIVTTRFDWIFGGAGNALTLGWGWLVDPFMDRAYNIDHVNLGKYCPQKISH